MKDGVLLEHSPMMVDELLEHSLMEDNEMLEYSLINNHKRKTSCLDILIYIE